MNANCFRARHLPLSLTILHCVLLIGCASHSPSKSKVSCPCPEIEGKWSWQQGQHHGHFVVTMEGDKCVGTLDDEFEGTYDDKLMDFNIVDKSISFKRYGKFGIQYWEGTLEKTGEQLKIVDGQWGRGSDILGSFEAEKTD